MSELHTCSQESLRWKRRKEDRPGEILAAALKTFASKGFTATRLDEVAKAAGISKGTLYLYFESKEALFKAVVTHFIVPQIARAEETAENFDGSIKELLTNLQEGWRENVLETDISGIPKIIMSEASNFPELAQFYLETVIHRSTSFISSLIEAGIKRGEFRQCDSQYVARSFMAPMVFMAIWQNSLAQFDQEYDMNEFMITSLEIFMRGIMKDNQA